MTDTTQKNGIVVEKWIAAIEDLTLKNRNVQNTLLWKKHKKEKN